MENTTQLVCTGLEMPRLRGGSPAVFSFSALPLREQRLASPAARDRHRRSSPSIGAPDKQAATGEGGVHALSPPASKECTFRQLLGSMSSQMHAEEDTLRAINPTDLVNKIMDGKMGFERGMQDDAHLLMSALRNAVAEEYKSEGGRQGDGMDRLFKATLVAETKCLRGSCKYRGTRNEVVFDVPLDICEGVESIESALEGFAGPERLDGDNLWNCGGCGHNVAAERRFSFVEAPQALVVQLKRFEFSATGMRKINKHISFSEDLVLTTAYGPRRYNLTGVTVHAGDSPHHGHYYAYVRSAGGGWKLGDDSFVSEVDFSTVQNSRPYVFYYTLCDGRGSEDRSCGDVACPSPVVREMTCAASRYVPCPLEYRPSIPDYHDPPALRVRRHCMKHTPMKEVASSVDASSKGSNSDERSSLLQGRWQRAGAVLGWGLLAWASVGVARRCPRLLGLGRK